MRSIPKGLKEDMASDPFYKRCCISGTTQGKIEWHHNLIFAGRQVNEKFCILPLVEYIHDNIVEYKDECDWIMWNRASDEQIRRFSKATNYFEVRDRLNKRFGTYTQ